MTAAESAAEWQSKWPGEHDCASSELLALADQAVGDFPSSSKFWLRRGQLILKTGDDYEFIDGEFVASMMKAIDLDPAMAEAYEALGSYHDGPQDDPDCAMEFYRKAAKLRGQGWHPAEQSNGF